MAVADIMRSQLRLTFSAGYETGTGEPIYTSKLFNNVKPSATASQLLIVAEAFARLQSHPLHKVERHDHSEISAS